MECKFEKAVDFIDMGIKELIDTLWNVNQVRKIGKVVFVRINRYIMECKLSTLPDKSMLTALN